MWLCHAGATMKIEQRNNMDFREKRIAKIQLPDPVDTDPHPWLFVEEAKIDRNRAGRGISGRGARASSSSKGRFRSQIILRTVLMFRSTEPQLVPHRTATAGYTHFVTSSRRSGISRHSSTAQAV